MGAPEGIESDAQATAASARPRLSVAAAAAAPAAEVAPTVIPDWLRYRPTQPVLFVIFGATGDLSRRKLLPSLYNLAVQGLLPDVFVVVGVAKDALSRDAFRAMAERAIRERSRLQPIDEAVLRRLLQDFDYEQVDFRDAGGFRRLGAKLDDLERQHHTGLRLYYCATPPATFTTVVRHMEAARMARGPETGQRRIVIEKPFGSSLASARELNALLIRVFGEEFVFRTDHYLGKETVQNIAAFRFANSIFEPLWSNQYVDNVQITVAEDVGIEGRAAYYERTGALRDMVQNHLLQLLALVTMEPPVSFDHVALRDERVKVLKAMAPITGEAVDERTVRAQYEAGLVGGLPVPGYRQEEGVAPDSLTETYVALKLNIDNWRWAQVPFYLRTGKRLTKQATQIWVEFKRPPHITFGRQATRELDPNAIVLRIQPDEGISLRFGAKAPAPGIRIQTVEMDFPYRRSFARSGGDAYEHLLVDSMLGDPTYFVRSDEVVAAWELIDPIEEHWAYGCPPLHGYPAGTWGPSEADVMVARDGRRWHRP